MAKEQVDACTKVLQRVRGTTEQQVLDTLLLVRRVASLDTVAPAVLAARAVELASLPAALLEEATDGYDAGVLGIAIPIRDP